MLMLTVMSSRKYPAQMLPAVVNPPVTFPKSVGFDVWRVASVPTGVKANLSDVAVADGGTMLPLTDGEMLLDDALAFRFDRGEVLLYLGD